MCLIAFGGTIVLGLSHLRIIPVEFGYSGCFMFLPAMTILGALHSGTFWNLLKCFQPLNITLWGTILTMALWSPSPAPMAQHTRVALQCCSTSIDVVGTTARR